MSNDLGTRGGAYNTPVEVPATGAAGGAGAARQITLTLSLPDHRLTLNRVRSHQSAGLRSRLVDEAKREATLVARDAVASWGDVPGFDPFPPDAPLFVAYDVERRKRGQRWDASGLIEAMKPAQDAWKGILYADDRQIVGYAVRWDPRPTGRGIVKVTIREVDRALSIFFPDRKEVRE